MNIESYLNKKTLFITFVILAVLATLRTLIVPLRGDELTYYKLAENILNGKFYLEDFPSTIAPVIPLVTAFFKLSVYPEVGILLNKLFNLLLVGWGFKYVYLILRKLGVDVQIILPIIVLTAVNSNSISFFPSLYPEAMIFFGFWGFIYYLIKPVNSKNILITLGFFTLLLFTRYVFIVLGVLLLLKYQEFLRAGFKEAKWKLFKYTLVFLLPVLFWGKYIYNIELQNVSEISYFDRFKGESPIIYNLKSGLGLEKHYEVSRINGIPAFASLFVPITGYRSYILSILLILAFVFGYYTKLKSLQIKKIFFSIVLIMLGYMFAGTGFSRYWLPMLPGIFLGYYFLSLKLNLKPKGVIIFSYCLALIYILNELRLNVKILTDYLA